MKQIIQVLAAASAGLMAGFCIGSWTQFKYSCAKCVERHVAKIIDPEVA